MSTALKKERDCQFTVTIPTELHEEVAAKATHLAADFDKTVELLLRYGLEAQSQREAEIARLADLVASTNDPAEREAAGNALGEMIFGR